MTSRDAEAKRIFLENRTNLFQSLLTKAAEQDLAFPAKTKITYLFDASRRGIDS